MFRMTFGKEKQLSCESVLHERQLYGAMIFPWTFVLTGVATSAVARGEVVLGQSTMGRLIGGTFICSMGNFPEAQFSGRNSCSVGHLTYGKY